MHTLSVNIIQTLKRLLDYLTLNSPGEDILRWMGWSIIKGLAAVDNSLSNGVTQAYQLIAFYDFKPLKAFIKSYTPLFYVMAGVAFAYLGWSLMIKHRTDYNKLIVNFLVIVTFFVAMPGAMTQLDKLVTTGQSDLSTSSSVASKMGDGTQIIKANITDLYLLDKAKFQPKNMDRTNYITSNSDVSLLDINEAVNTGDDSPLSADGKKVFAKKLDNSTGKLALQDMQTHWFTADEAYYRYSWHPFLMMISLLMTMVVVLSTMFKVAQLSMELVVVKALAIGSSFTDLESGQRTKKLILKIRNIFIVLYLQALTLKIYFLFLNYVSSVTGLSELVRVIFTVAAGFLVMDGPNIIEELFGINAGMGSAIKGAMGLMGAGFLAARAGSAAIHAGKGLATMGKKAAGRAATVGGAALGAGKGALDGFKEKATAGASGNVSASADKLGKAMGSSSGKEASGGGLSGMKAPLSNEAATQQMGQKVAAAAKGMGFSPATAGASGATGAPSASSAEASGSSSARSSVPGGQDAAASAPQAGGQAAATTGTSGSSPASSGGGAFAGFGSRSVAPPAPQTVRRAGAARLPASVSQRAAAGKQAMADSMPKPTTRETLGQAAGRKLTEGYAGMAERVSGSAPFQAYRKGRDLTHNSIAGPPPPSVPTQEDGAPGQAPSGAPDVTASSLSHDGGVRPDRTPSASPMPRSLSVAPRSDAAPLAASRTPQPLHPYSPANQKAIQEQHPGAQAVGSAGFWRSHGVTVQPGAAPITISVPVKDAAGRVTEFDTGSVYDISQTTMAPARVPGWLAKNVKEGVKK